MVALRTVGIGHSAETGRSRWLSTLAASVVGAYKLKDVVDLIITAIMQK